MKKIMYFIGGGWFTFWVTFAALKVGEPASGGTLSASLPFVMGGFVAISMLIGYMIGYMIGE